MRTLKIDTNFGLGVKYSVFQQRKKNLHYIKTISQ